MGTVSQTRQGAFLFVGSRRPRAGPTGGPGKHPNPPPDPHLPFPRANRLISGTVSRAGQIPIRRGQRGHPRNPIPTQA